MKDKKFYEKKEISYSKLNPRKLQSIYKSNNSEKTKSQSLNKYTVSIDKDQILKEFYLYKLNSTNSTSKSNKNSRLNKSFTKSSKSKTSREKILIPVKSLKIVKNFVDKNNYTSNKIVQKNNFGKIEQNIYNDLIKKIEEKKVNIHQIKNPEPVNVRPQDNKEKSIKKNFSREKINNNRFNVMDLLRPASALTRVKSKKRQNSNNLVTIQNDKDSDSQKNCNLKTNTNDNSIDYMSNTNNNLLQNIKYQNGNFEKYQSYLIEKISFLKTKIKEDLAEKDKLICLLKEQESNQNVEIQERLESEIKNYRKMKQSCIITYSKLTSEIEELKKEIEKYSYTTTKTHYSPLPLNHNNNNNPKINVTAKEKRTKRMIIDSPIKFKIK